jgi:hypothetical protein
MKQILCGLVLIALLAPCIALSQTGVPGPGPTTMSQSSRTQPMTILPPSFRARIGCCVAPYNKIWIYRNTPIVWNNESGFDVRLKFGTGTTCNEVAPKDVAKIEARLATGCYTVPLKAGQTFRMTFAEPGQFSYSLEYVNPPAGVQPEGGTIGVF